MAVCVISVHRVMWQSTLSQPDLHVSQDSGNHTGYAGVRGVPRSPGLRPVRVTITGALGVEVRVNTHRERAQGESVRGLRSLLPSSTAFL